MATLAGVVPVPCLVVETLSVVLLAGAVPVVRGVLVPVGLVVRFGPTTSLRPDVPTLASFEPDGVTVLLPPSVEVFEVFFTFPAFTGFLVAEPLPVEKSLRCP